MKSLQLLQPQTSLLQSGKITIKSHPRSLIKSNPDSHATGTMISSKKGGLWRLLFVFIFSSSLCLFYWKQSILGISLTFSIAASIITNVIIPDLTPLLLAARVSGRDLNKINQPILPESMGTAAGSVYLVMMFLFIPFAFLNWSDDLSRLQQTRLETLGNYTAALLSVSCMLFLGFVDDIINLKWRHKLLIPSFSSLPLLVIYCLTCNETHIVVPLILRSCFGRIVDLGFIYYIYMLMVVIFCTHSINILAGINGVEVGQSLIIAIFVSIHSVIEIASSSKQYENHYFSLFIILPFIAVSSTLLRYNWFPAKVFVGDTFCYFAGMTLAVSAVLAHFTKTLLLLFIPQILNFLLSIPQLFGIVPCPRHRLPCYNHKTLKLEPSLTVCSDSASARFFISIFSKLGLIQTTFSTETGKVIFTNFTLLNFLLVRFGSMKEQHLATLFLSLQFIWCAVALFIRHWISHYFF